MSGGHFNYEQYKINDIADSIERLIETNNIPLLEGWDEEFWGKESLEDFRRRHRYSPAVIARFQEAVDILRKGAVYAQRIDWLISDDGAEDSFHERLIEELDKLPADYTIYPCAHRVEMAIAKLVCPVCERLLLEKQCDTIETLTAENKGLNESLEIVRHDSWGQAGVIEKLEASVTELQEALLGLRFGLDEYWINTPEGQLAIDAANHALPLKESL